MAYANDSRYDRPTVAKVQEIAVKIGKYTGKDGQERGRYLNIGTLITMSDGRQYGTLTAMPLTFVPDKAGRCTFGVFDRRDKDGTETQAQEGQAYTPGQQSAQGQFQGGTQWQREAVKAAQAPAPAPQQPEKDDLPF